MVWGCEESGEGGICRDCLGDQDAGESVLEDVVGHNHQSPLRAALPFDSSVCISWDSPPQICP